MFLGYNKKYFCLYFYVINVGKIKKIKTRLDIFRTKLYLQNHNLVCFGITTDKMPLVEI